MIQKSWILIGMMGAGKSSVGRALAALSGREFRDTDQLLQNRLGRPISQLFQIYGEDAFRDHETCLLRSLEPEPCVLSTGGGIVLREQNWTEMKRLGLVIYLDAECDTLIERLDRSKKRRPLLETDEWQERVRSILESRLDLYERADVKVCVNDTDIEQGAARIFEKLREVGAV
jgi:shikimate kinase